MVTLGAFFRVRFWVPFLHAFGGAFGIPLGIIWETFWGPWDPLGQPWRPLGLSWGPLGTLLVSLRIPFCEFTPCIILYFLVTFSGSPGQVVSH